MKTSRVKSASKSIATAPPYRVVIGFASDWQWLSLRHCLGPALATPHSTCGPAHLRHWLSPLPHCKCHHPTTCRARQRSFPQILSEVWVDDVETSDRRASVRSRLNQQQLIQLALAATYNER